MTHRIAFAVGLFVAVAAAGGADVRCRAVIPKQETGNGEPPHFGRNLRKLGHYVQ